LENTTFNRPENPGTKLLKIKYPFKKMVGKRKVNSCRITHFTGYLYLTGPSIITPYNSI
jgi:hypothetical protein